MLIYASLAAVLGVIVGIAHSVLGERVLLGPLYREVSTGVLANRSSRDIFRAVFHIPSIAWSALGIAVLVNRIQDGGDLLPLTAALVFAISGIGNLAALRRPHPGGLILLAMATAALADIYFN
ncbi:hypothetical protein SAMN02745824_1017 [Parasphingorhabdus marina DSM 22363]|uniref:Uncharacterized protein n=1 Tax=Parasphingorhabdus marina DSM 22363 TaxID=1123272 RepID=A0A1N6CU31_9SPHN|nr:hypothetical protein [Parasphingorhabdus marina]SIN62138.1 hypothetical protein SAMN02745824_1017 [Parasphingorhabdus marina DSM 22363]